MCFSYNSDTDCDMVVPIPDSSILVCIYSYSLGSSTRKYSAGPLGKIHNDHTHSTTKGSQGKYTHTQSNPKEEVRGESEEEGRITPKEKNIFLPILHQLFTIICKHDRNLQTCKPNHPMQMKECRVS
jgi:hypothetical protein